MLGFLITIVNMSVEVGDCEECGKYKRSFQRMRVHKQVSYKNVCDETPCRLEHEYYCMNPRCGKLFTTDATTWAREASEKVIDSQHWPYHDYECAEDNDFLFWKEREIVYAI